MSKEVRLPRQIEWRPQSLVVEEIRHKDRATSLSQLLALNVQHLLPSYARQRAVTSGDTVLSPHEPTEQKLLEELVGPDALRWAQGMFYFSGENGIGTGVGWGFSAGPSPYEVTYRGVMVSSTPGHIVISGDKAAHIDVSCMDADVEELFRKALHHAVEVGFGNHNISFLNINRAVSLADVFPRDHLFD